MKTREKSSWRIAQAPVLNDSGFRLRGLAGIAAVKPDRCVVEDVTITGEAPKDFLRIYLHGEARREIILDCLSERLNLFESCIN